MPNAPNTTAAQPSKTSRPTLWLWCELCCLFIISPLTLALPLSISVKLSVVLGALLYCIIISKSMGLFNQSSLIGQDWHHISRKMTARFILFAVISTILVWLFIPDALFSVVIGNPWLWMGISFFYAIFSVYPQEFLYRLFFFKRYQHLIVNQHVFIIFNAGIFCFAHVFFLNFLVFLLTFVGGILFALTYKKSQSTLLASIEHSAYGLWLFTLGLGDMLAFPGA